MTPTAIPAFVPVLKPYDAVVGMIDTDVGVLVLIAGEVGVGIWEVEEPLTPVNDVLVAATLDFAVMLK